jgi:hypothetical protein
MTPEQATRRLRRCADCGRFLSSDGDDDLCMACGETANAAVSEHKAPENGSANDSANGSANGHAPMGDLTPIPIETPDPIDAPMPTEATALPEPPMPSATAPRPTTTGPANGAMRPPRGVVIMRPSELHPEKASPIAVKAPEVAVERQEPPTAVEIQPRIRPFVDVLPEPMPRPAPEPVDWTLRIVVGVAIGVLVGIAIPLVLTLR